MSAIIKLTAIIRQYYTILKCQIQNQQSEELEELKNKLKLTESEKANIKCNKTNDLLLKSGDKAKQKIFTKIPINLMQVAKSGVVNKKLLQEKFLNYQKKLNV